MFRSWWFPTHHCDRLVSLFTFTDFDHNTIQKKILHNFHEDKDTDTYEMRKRNFFQILQSFINPARVFLWRLLRGRQTRVVRFRPKVGQIGPKRDKSGIFSDQISGHFGAPRQNVLKSDLKKSWMCPFSSQSDPLRALIYHHWPDRIFTSYTDGISRYSGGLEFFIKIYNYW